MPAAALASSRRRSSGRGYRCSVTPQLTARPVELGVAAGVVLQRRRRRRRRPGSPPPPYFLRSEDNSRGDSEFHRAGGELRVTEQRSPRPLDRRLLDASASAGIPVIADYNGPEQDGAAMFQVTQRNGRRWSAADAFLRSALDRPNLELVTGATVTGLELERGRALGVRYRRRRGEDRLARADREVILAAGAIGSPQLMLLWASARRGPARGGHRTPARAARRRAQPAGSPVR